MVELDVKVVLIESGILKTDGEVSTLLKFADLFRKMKHLEDFSFGFEEFGKDNLLPMEKLTDIPFKSINSGNFKMEKETIKDVANVLSQMRYLEKFELEEISDEEYCLTVEDFALFKHLPVHTVYLAALDLREENVADFRRIMKEMKIECIVNCYEDLGISPHYFGPGDRYLTI